MEFFLFFKTFLEVDKKNSVFLREEALRRQEELERRQNQMTDISSSSSSTFSHGPIFRTASSDPPGDVEFEYYVSETFSRNGDFCEFTKFCV